MFGAKDSATASTNGSLLQLRALDWDTDGPFKNFATVVVYHPNAGEGNAWANVGFAGWTASITGFSEQQIGLSEIGVSPTPHTNVLHTRVCLTFTWCIVSAGMYSYPPHLFSTVSTRRRVPSLPSSSSAGILLQHTHPSDSPQVTIS